MIPTEFPETHAELYDLLQREFGVGTYDDIAGTEAWFRARMTEIGKVKRLCRARRATPRQVAIAAWYAKEHRVVVRATHRLMPLIPEAMREYNQTLAAEKREAAERELNLAINLAMRNGRQDWADRLLRTSADDAPQVLKEWRAAQ